MKPTLLLTSLTIYLHFTTTRCHGKHQNPLFRNTHPPLSAPPQENPSPTHQRSKRDLFSLFSVVAESASDVASAVSQGVDNVVSEALGTISGGVSDAIVFVGGNKTEQAVAAAAEAFGVGVAEAEEAVVSTGVSELLKGLIDAIFGLIEVPAEVLAVFAVVGVVVVWVEVSLNVYYLYGYLSVGNYLGVVAYGVNIALAVINFLF